MWSRFKERIESQASSLTLMVHKKGEWVAYYFAHGQSVGAIVVAITGEYGEGWVIDGPTWLAGDRNQVIIGTVWLRLRGRVIGGGKAQNATGKARAEEWKNGDQQYDGCPIVRMLVEREVAKAAPGVHLTEGWLDAVGIGNELDMLHAHWPWMPQPVAKATAVALRGIDHLRKVSFGWGSDGGISDYRAGGGPNGVQLRVDGTSVANDSKTVYHGATVAGMYAVRLHV